MLTLPFRVLSFTLLFQVHIRLLESKPVFREYTITLPQSVCCSVLNNSAVPCQVKVMQHPRKPPTLLQMLSSFVEEKESLATVLFCPKQAHISVQCSTQVLQKRMNLL